jgi:multiple sugar transport system substrate-binding protein
MKRSVVSPALWLRPVRLTTHSARRCIEYLLLLSILLASCAQFPAKVRGQVLIAWHSLTGAREQALLSLVDEWNRTNPTGITVVPERRTAQAMQSSVNEGLAQKALPALMLVSPTQAALYYQKGILASLNAYMDATTDGVGWSNTDRSDLYPFVLKTGRVANGQIVGLPFGGAVRVMLYNRDWLKTLNLDSAPADWDQFNAACANATDRTKGTLCLGLNPDSITFQQWLYAYGGQSTTDDMSVLQVSTPAALNAMNHLSDFLRAAQAYRVTTRVQSRDDFAATRVLFMTDWSDQLDDVRAAIKERGEFDWGLALLPAQEGQAVTPYRAPLWVIAQTPETTDPDRAMSSWLFLRWLMAVPQTTRWAQATGELPARRSALDAFGARQALSANQTLLLQTIAPQARPDPMLSGWKCVQNVLANSMRQIFEGRAVTETLQIAQATGQSELNYDCSNE